MTCDDTLITDNDFERDPKYIPGRGAIVVRRPRRSKFYR